MIGNINKILIILVIVLGPINLLAQEQPKSATLLTGVILDASGGEKIPFVNVQLKNTFYGTATDVNGYFSIFLNPGDTLTFSYVGYQEANFIMPFDLETNQYALLQLLERDTVFLREVVIFPWPSYSHFVRAFLDTEPSEEMKDFVVEVKQNLNQTFEEVELSKYYHEQQRYQRLFLMHDIFPAQNFLDPKRWTDFIKDLRTEDEEQVEIDDY